MDKKEYLDKAKEIYEMFGYNDVEITMIVRQREDSSLFRCVGYRKSDYDTIVIIDSTENELCFQIPDWDFGIDEELFAFLENGYEIVEVPLEIHAAIWNRVDKLREEIDYKEGLQEYLDYCKKNDITHKSLSLVEKVADISDLYQETNGSYKIIAEISINNNSIVLGHNPKAPSPYVTWDTRRDRKYGFHYGHYHVDYRSAFNDFRERTESMYRHQIDMERGKSRPKKKEIEHGSR